MTIDTRFRRYDLGTRYPGRCLTNLLTRINELTLRADSDSSQCFQLQDEGRH
jgi:hypothetical protein